MKKLFLFLLCAVLLCAGLCGCKPAANPASDFEYRVSDSYGDAGGVLIQKYVGTATTVVIPEKIEGKPVFNIDIMAFANTNIEKVVIPDTVINIADMAFKNCPALKEVVFGSGLQIICRQAFMNCPSLQEAILPSSLRTLNYEAFSLCTSLKKVRLPKSLTLLGSAAFLLCPVEELILEDGITMFGSSYAFSGSKFKTLTIPASVQTIGSESFIVYSGELEQVFLKGTPRCPLGKNRSVPRLS